MQEATMDPLGSSHGNQTKRNDETIGKRNETTRKDAKTIENEQTIENDWNNKTKRNDTFELILIDKNLDSEGKKNVQN